MTSALRLLPPQMQRGKQDSHRLANQLIHSEIGMHQGTGTGYETAEFEIFAPTNPYWSGHDLQVGIRELVRRTPLMRTAGNKNDALYMIDVEQP
jgi:hypothetical protein